MDRIHPELSGAQRMGIAAEQLVPLIEVMEAELGADVAHRLVRQSVAQQARTEVQVHLRAQGRSKLVLRAMAEPHGSSCVAEYLPSDKARFDFDVTACGYAELCRELGRPDFGYLLLCESDEWAANELPDVHFERASTLMQGGDRCRFRYGFSAGQSSTGASAVATDQ